MFGIVSSRHSFMFGDHSFSVQKEMGHLRHELHGGLVRHPRPREDELGQVCTACQMSQICHGLAVGDCEGRQGRAQWKVGVTKLH